MISIWRSRDKKFWVP